MINCDYGQIYAHITRIAVVGMTCGPHKGDISWLLLALWSNLSFCLIRIPDQHTMLGTESCCDTAVSFSYTFQQNPHVCGWGMPSGASTPGPQSPVQSYMAKGMNGDSILLWTNAEWEPDMLQLCSHTRFPGMWTTQAFLMVSFKTFAEEAKSLTPWKEKEEHRAKLLVQINSAV